MEKTERKQMKWPVGTKWHSTKGTEVDYQLVNAVLYRKDIEEIKSLLKQGADPTIRVLLEVANTKGEIIKSDAGDLLYLLVTQEPKILNKQNLSVKVNDKDMQKRLDKKEDSKQDAKQHKFDIETANKIIEIADLLLSKGCDISLSELAENELAQYKPVDEYIKKAYEVHKVVKQQMRDAGYEYTKDNHKELDKLLATKRAKYIKTDCSLEELQDIVKQDPDISVPLFEL